MLERSMVGVNFVLRIELDVAVSGVGIKPEL